MITTADFYTGHGRHAVWLGSLQGDADPETVRGVACGRLLLDATDPLTYADAVTDLLDVWADENLGHGYHPRDGWPWLWPDSRETDWVFTFAHGRGADHDRPRVAAQRRTRSRTRNGTIGGDLMNDDTENTDNNPENTGQRSEFRVLDFLDRCPDCDVVVGEAHVARCDVARCLVTGLQRSGCEAEHDCGTDTWSGRWPGEADCQRLGWMLGPGLPDLNRLYTEATWDPARRAWVTPT